MTSAQALIGGCDAAILAQLRATPILPGQRLYLSSARQWLIGHGILRSPRQISGYDRLVSGALDQTVYAHLCFIQAETYFGCPQDRATFHLISLAIALLKQHSGRPDQSADHSAELLADIASFVCQRLA